MKIVIWGHKLHSHTHSYVHQGFFNGFMALGHEVHWFDNNDDVRDFDFSETLFLTEGQVDEKMPLRRDCRYVLHYCDPKRYLEFGSRWNMENNIVFLERTLASEKRRLISKTSGVDVMDEWTFVENEYKGTPGWRQFDNKIGRAIYMLWATNLLPHQFDYEAALWPRTLDVNWIGTIGTGIYGNDKEVGPFALACDIHHLPFRQYEKLSEHDHIGAIKASNLAPTIVGRWQIENGYIPCRLFKNISYGTVTFTNSWDVSTVMEGRVHCEEDTFQLFHDGKEITEAASKDYVIDCMQFVAKRHTYINRCEAILRYFQ